MSTDIFGVLQRDLRSSCFDLQSFLENRTHRCMGHSGWQARYFYQRLIQWLSAATLIGFLAASGLMAQDKFPGGKLGFPADFKLPSNRSVLGVPVALSASYELDRAGKVGRIKVTAKLPDGKHVYSTTQPPGGPSKTDIKLTSSAAKVVGPFQSDHAPTISETSVWPGLPIEEHHGAVVWTAPIELVDDLASTKADISVKFDGLLCADGDGGNCEPVTETVPAKFAGFYGAEKKSSSYRAEHSHATVTARMEPAQVTPGAKSKILIRIQPDAGYHVYPFQPHDPQTEFRTLITVSTKSGLRFGAPTTDAQTEEVKISDSEKIVHHVGTVEWSIPVDVPATAADGDYPIEILVGYVTCDQGSCDPPAGTLVSGTLKVAKEAIDAAPLAMSLSESDFRIAADHPALISWIDPEKSLVARASNPKAPKSAVSGPATSLTAWHLMAAIFGGFLLNFMPCVLPVIGLKIMSFVDQSGNDHRRVIVLNLAFVFGLMSVLWVLAAITVIAKVAFGTAFGWGEHFTLLEFKVAIAALLFAMSLSFLGVWEIPIPGFATGSASGKLMEREGFNGAFIKGVLTTLLATPCSGPLLGTLFGLSLSQSAGGVFTLYTAVGLGMAAPYLALCISPSLVRVLPKPGAWMETLKQALAFPLLLTVVFFVASISDGYRIATLILLIVVWFGCWLIGRVPPYAERSRIRTAWLTSGAIIAAGTIISFGIFGPSKHDLPWQPYSAAALSVHRGEGRTVMIDFTANWCVNCQINTAIAIDRPKVARLVEEYGIVPLLADWTERSDEIRTKLAELQSNSIPLLAIYPADPDAEPIILRDLISESQLIKSLLQAGPSQVKGRLATLTHHAVGAE